MALIKRYLKEKRNDILIFILTIGIFAMFMALYLLPFKAIVYPVLLSVFLYSGYIAVDFISVKNKHDILKNIANSPDMNPELLPVRHSIESRDLYKIIAALTEKYNDFKADSRRRYNDMIDWYTMWVHQIKTPIASMKLQLQNRDGEFSGGLSNDLFRIEQYADMVLTFLRVHSDYNDYVIRQQDLDKIITCAVKKYSGEFILRKIKLVYSPLNTLIVTDEKWLMFVVEQVLSNALKYTHEGSISIYMSDKNKLCIEDTGMGIAPEDLPRIFEKSYTGQNGRTNRTSSGLGLYLCKTICNKLGHKIYAKSTLGHGTCITIDFGNQKSDFE